ncbi:MAG: ABC transporter substrate-binding protein [Erysipelotrichaceae bacterium]
MKKIVLLCSVLLLVLSGCGSSVDNSKNTTGCETLKVFNWGVYIDDETKDKFEDQYGVKVIYDEYTSNEEMYTKLLGGEVYDILYPSDYMVQRLIAENALQAIDKTALSNYNNLLDDVIGWEFDPENTYSIPYFWGSVGILYNKNNVSETELKNEGFNILRNSKYQGEIYMYDSERDSFMVALKALGYSMNTSDTAELNEAYQWLIDQKKEVNPILGTDDIIDNMVAGLKDLAIMYSGDATYIMSENPVLGYYVPDTGSNVWLDSMVIPAESKCVDLANLWIDFQLSEKIATANSEWVGYSSSVQSVYEEIASDYYADYDSYTTEINANDEVFQYNAEVKEIISDLWTRVKAS